MEIKINPKAEQTDTIIFLRTKEQAEKENMKDFKGKDFELHWYYDTDSRKFFVGLGEEEKVTKEKIRKASTGRYHTQEEKNKISKANTGRVFTPEHRQHISEAKKKRRDA